jgi:hypothetical protein
MMDVTMTRSSMLRLFSSLLLFLHLTAMVLGVVTTCACGGCCGPRVQETEPSRTSCCQKSEPSDTTCGPVAECDCLDADVASVEYPAFKIASRSTALDSESANAEAWSAWTASCPAEGPRTPGVTRANTFRKGPSLHLLHSVFLI